MVSLFFFVPGIGSIVHNRTACFFLPRPSPHADTPFPLAHEKYYLPAAAKVLEAIKHVVRY